MYLLAIETSCDDTAAAVLSGTQVLSNIRHTQIEHEKWGGVVPELASRLHVQNILPVVLEALDQAGIHKHQLSGVAVTFGPGLMGCLLVGVNFAKTLALALGIPLIAVNHLQAHALSPFIGCVSEMIFPYIGLIVSGGHTQILEVSSPFKMRILGQSIDDAVGEAFDKIAKMMGFPYPGGPHIDRGALGGDAKKYPFTRPKVKEFDFSFSGIKTQFRYFLEKKQANDPSFLDKERHHICASIQHALVGILLHKVEGALKRTRITRLAIGGGVSMNRELRDRFTHRMKELSINLHLPQPDVTTDNAAMVGLVGYYKYINNDFADVTLRPKARTPNLTDGS